MEDMIIGLESFFKVFIFIAIVTSIIPSPMIRYMRCLLRKYKLSPIFSSAYMALAEYIITIPMAERVAIIKNIELLALRILCLYLYNAFLKPFLYFSPPP